MLVHWTLVEAQKQKGLWEKSSLRQNTLRCTEKERQGGVFIFLLHLRNCLSFKKVFQTWDYVTFKAGRSVKFIYSKNLTLQMRERWAPRKNGNSWSSRQDHGGPDVFFLVTNLETARLITVSLENDRVCSMLKKTKNSMFHSETVDVQRVSIHLGHCK